MKKILLCIISLFILTAAHAQRKKEFQIRGGFGWSIYSSTSEFTYNIFGVNIMEKNDDAAATVHLPLEFRYELTRRFNLGLDIKYGSYLYDPDSAEGKSNRFFVIGVAAEYNFISNDNFRWYAGAGFNASSLELQEDYVFFGAPTKDIVKYNGPGFRINSGLLWFFAGPLGLNFNLGFDSHNFTLKDFEQNGQNLDLSNIDGKLTVKGVDGTIGLVLRL